ncbi:helix-turn-helix transcriptional regulator [Microlunatus ginsengisoli]|uniref:LuxR family transcriptional regulator n=1 Tax=Microlunatus ginsengisoli TaxID=363863 RepID=A0ABP7AS58_9ACTN
MSTVFVGRRDELASLHGQLARAASGVPTVALVEGIGGAGKSALLDQCAAAAGSVALLRVSGDAEETGIAYGVLDQLLAALDGSGPGTGHRSPRQDGTLVRSGDLQTTGEHLLGELLQATTRHPPVVLMVDDAHLADRPSLAALSFAVRRLQNEPVLTVLAVRPDGVAGLPAGLVKLVDAGGARLELGGLGVSEIRELAARFGRGRISDRVARRLQEHTAGSPLHVRALLSDGRMDAPDWLAAPLPAPQRYARLIAVQAAQLSAAARGLALAASVLGFRSDLRVAATVARLEDPLSAVDELHRSGFLRLVRTPERTELVFEHMLIRSALLEDCGPAELAALHLAAAEATSGADALFHRAQATAAPDPRLAADLLDLARADVARGSWRTAANALLAAARLESDADRRDSALIRGVYALLVAGDLAVARSYRELIAGLPPTPRRAQVEALMAWQSGDFAEAEAVAVRGWSAASELEPLERDRMAGLIAQMCIWQGRNVEAIEWSEASLHSGLLDSRGQAMTLATLVGAMALEGRAPEAMRLLPTDGDLADAGYRELVGMRGILELLGDEPAGAADRLRIRLRPNLADHRREKAPAEVLSATGPDGIEPNKMMVLLFLADAEFRRGRWDVSAAIADQVLALAEDTDQSWIMPWAHAQAALVPASRGQWSEAEALLAAAELGAARLGGEFNCVYAANAAAHLAACRGQPDRVVAAADRLRSAGTPFRKEPGMYCWPVHFADALLALHRDAEAEAVIDEWSATAQALGRRSRLAALSRVRGDLAVQRRDLSAARAAYDVALELGDDDCEVLQRAMVFASRGRFLRRRGERRAAISDLCEAEQRFRSLGAAPFLENLRSELAACGVEAGTRADDTGRLSALTPQENAVARLVAAGRSNREIAELLVLSPKTVAYHLSHVYAKLGIRSRAELAASRPFTS